MKRAMWSVDRSGGFEFSDKFVSDRSSIFEYSDGDLQRCLVADLAGQTLPVKDIGEYALANSPAYKYFEALCKMEREGQIRPVTPPVGQRVGSFRDYPDMLVEVRRVVRQTQASLFDG